MIEFLRNIDIVTLLIKLKNMSSLYDINVQKPNGETVSMSEYR